MVIFMPDIIFRNLNGLSSKFHLLTLKEGITVIPVQMRKLRLKTFNTIRVPSGEEEESRFKTETTWLAM